MKKPRTAPVTQENKGLPKDLDFSRYGTGKAVKSAVAWFSRSIHMMTMSLGGTPIN